MPRGANLIILTVFNFESRCFWGVTMERKAERDRKIPAAYEAGQGVEKLSEVHGRICARIAKILTAERNKRTVGPEPFYRAIRKP
jgi:hypothetical protein